MSLFNRNTMTKRKMYKEMKKILRYVESGGNPHITTEQESDLWGECVKRGFLNVSSDSCQDESGFWHVTLINHNISPAGIEWLYAPNANRKSSISIAVSIIALFISILVNFSQITAAISSIISWLGF